MIINKWDTDCRENDNVSVNDGAWTYFAEWDLEDGPIEFDAVAEDYKDGAYYDEKAEVTIEITNLLTGASEYHELVWGKDDENDDEDGDEDDADDADDDGDDEDDTEDEGARAALWHGEIDFLDRYQPPGRRGR